MSQSSFLRSLSIQKRVIFALIMREMLTRYGRNNIGILWLLIEPMIFTLAIMSLAIFARVHHLSGISVVGFALTGYSCLLFWRNTANRGKQAITSNTGLLFHRNVRILDIFYARILLELAGGTASFLLLITIFTSLQLMALPKDAMYVIYAWILLGWFGTSLALCIGILSEQFDAFGRIWNASSFPLFTLSGAMFMVDWIPEPARSYLLWVPMVHGTEMLRHGYFGSIVPTYESPSYLISINLFLSFMGLSLVKRWSEGAYFK